jgi:hypothetical protein
MHHEDVAIFGEFRLGSGEHLRHDLHTHVLVTIAMNF